MDKAKYQFLGEKNAQNKRELEAEISQLKSEAENKDKEIKNVVAKLNETAAAFVDVHKTHATTITNQNQLFNLVETKLLQAENKLVNEVPALKQRNKELNEENTALLAKVEQLTEYLEVSERNFHSLNTFFRVSEANAHIGNSTKIISEQKQSTIFGMEFKDMIFIFFALLVAMLIMIHTVAN